MGGIQKAIEGVVGFLPAKLRETALLRAFGLFQVPMLLYVAPTIEEITDDRCVVRVPLNRRNRNHVRVMYIGALVAGADCAGGLMAMRQVRLSGRNVVLLFKDLKANFLKRVEGDAHFVCEEGRAIRDLVDRAIQTRERVNLPVKITVKVPSKLGEEPAAEFEMTLSLKLKE